jgi:hypothetical protein
MTLHLKHIHQAKHTDSKDTDSKERQRESEENLRVGMSVFRLITELRVHCFGPDAAPRGTHTHRLTLLHPGVKLPFVVCDSSAADMHSDSGRLRSWESVPLPLPLCSYRLVTYPDSTFRGRRPCGCHL